MGRVFLRSSRRRYLKQATRATSTPQQLDLLLQKRPRKYIGPTQEKGVHLGVRARVSDDEQTRLAELLGDLVGESSGSEAAGDGQATRVLGKLEHGTLAVRSGRDRHNVL